MPTQAQPASPSPAQRGAAPNDGALPWLSDSFGRQVTYLRLSITDRCNFRCVYCMPAEGITLQPSRELLTFEEIERVVRLLASGGVRRVRVTGGEPLVRKGALELIGRVAAVEGIEEVVLTTNGTRLDTMAGALRAAGLRSVTVSLDSLQAERFAAITRGGRLDQVVRGVDAALEAGLDVRLNAVIVRGVNDDELLDLTQWAIDRRVLLRMIEFMPIGTGTAWGKLSQGGCVPAQEMRAVLSARWRLEPLGMKAGQGPARYLRLEGPGVPDGVDAKVGIISAVTECFCDACNRIRLTPQGGMRACLADDRELSLRDMMRAGASDADLIEAVRAALYGKRVSHTFDLNGDPVTQRRMVSIGG